MAQKRRFTRFSRKGRFRRKRRSTWFPTTGTVWSNAELAYYDSAFTSRTSQAPADLVNGPTVDVFPITPDFTAQPSENQQPDLTAGFNFTLRDLVEGQSWMLDRIVGNAFLRCDIDSGEVAPTAAWAYVRACLAFFVARSSDSDEGIPDIELNSYDPFATDNINNPWIWRNTWILANPQTTQVGAIIEPPTNWFSGGDWLGPHIDSKVKRRIPREHRLWAALGVIGWDGTRTAVQAETTQPQVSYTLDLRVLGHMVRQVNRSSF